MKWYALFFLLMMAACSSSEPVVDKTAQPSDATLSETTPNNATNTDQTEDQEYPYLSSLADTYFNRTNSIPEEYQQIKEEIVEVNANPYEGYRIQIFSGQNVALADTAAKKFRAWSAEHIEGYQAETYTFFKAPYYRVHVGDFHDRDEAISFSNMLKRRFRDSWVVFDRVDPFKVPADSVQIFTKD